MLMIPAMKMKWIGMEENKMEVRDFRERSRKAMIDRQKSVYPEGYPNRMSDFFSVTLKLVDVNDSRYETLLKAYVDWALVYCDYASVLCLPEDVEGLYNKSFELAIPLWNSCMISAGIIMNTLVQKNY